MSLVLEYLSHGGAAPDLRRLESWHRDMAHFEGPKREDGLLTWWYRNAHTGVYFSTSFAPPARDAVGEEHAPCGLHATLNHLRPHYFALEASRYLAALSRDFGLACRPAGGDGILLEESSADAFVSLWERGNADLRDEVEESGHRVHLVPREVNAYWWEYSRRRGAIEEFLASQGEGIRVPEMHFLHRASDDRMLTAVCWENEGPFVFPQCDLVVIDRTQAKLFGLKKERSVGQIAYEKLMKQIVGALRTIEVDGFSLRLLTTENLWRVRERLPHVDVDPDMSSFTGVAPTRVLDEA